MAGKNLSRRERFMFVFTTTVAVSAGLFKFVIEPLHGQWKALNAEIKAKSVYIVKNRRLLNKYKSLEEEYIKFPSLSAAVESEEKEVLKALGSIEALYKSCSCNIQNVKPRTSKKIGSYKEISFEVTAEGNIESFSKILYQLETSEEMLRAKRFTITSRMGKGSNLKGIFLISKIIVD